MDHKSLRDHGICLAPDASGSLGEDCHRECHQGQGSELRTRPASACARARKVARATAMATPAARTGHHLAAAREFDRQGSSAL